MPEFTWVPFYQELADKLAPHRSRQAQLLEYLNGLRASQLPITPFTDRDAEGRGLPLDEIDPFTFFAVFNRRITEDNRVRILQAMKTQFGVEAPVPGDFTGIPVLHPMNSWFFDYKPDRPAGEVDRLWEVFLEALKLNPLDGNRLASSFDAAVEHLSPFKLTIGLYWVRPQEFLPLDSRTRSHLGVELRAPTFADYRALLERIRRSDNRRFVEISRDAFGQAPPAPAPPLGNNCWLVGAWWDDANPPDKTEEFVRSGVWRNGYKDRYLEQVRQMKAGDRIAIKAATTQRDDLPFEYSRAVVSKMVIKARGIIVANPGDGREVKVDWDQDFEPRDWYFYTNRQTVWKLVLDSEYARLLVDFIFHDKAQDIAFFLSRWEREPPREIDPGADRPTTYSREEALDGLFIEPAEWDALVALFRERKNLVLQGAPGVGKTFMARRLAYALLRAKDESRIQSVQFHQSYAYEDFVQGFRPSLGAAGAMTFTLRNGVFYDFCMQARSTDEPHVFIIDEINRGNLSRIFGELMVLLEPDKRGEKHALRLTYQQPEDPRFFVPANVHVLGLMNLADRSLAMVDYALRRRFGFFDLQPRFASPLFRAWLVKNGLSEQLADSIIGKLQDLNARIAEDPQLGRHFEIGHSYFCSWPDGANRDEAWYRRIVETQVGPLLREYWYDDQKKAEGAVGALLEL